MNWTLDAQGVAVHLSPEWQAYTGLREADVIGQRPTSAVHPDDAEAVAELIREAVRSTSPFLLSFRIRRANDSYAWVTAGGSPAFGPADGEVLGYLGKTVPMEQTIVTPRVRNILKAPPVMVFQSSHQIVLLDALADHISMARTLAKQARNEKIGELLDNVLMSIGTMMYETMQN